MIRKLLLSFLIFVIFSIHCIANAELQSFEPKGLFWIEGTLWGYELEDFQDVALGFYEGSVYLVSLGILPITLKVQTSDYYDLFLY